MYVNVQYYKYMKLAQFLNNHPLRTYWSHHDCIFYFDKRINFDQITKNGSHTNENSKPDENKR